RGAEPLRLRSAGSGSRAGRRNVRRLALTSKLFARWRHRATDRERGRLSRCRRGRSVINLGDSLVWGLGLAVVFPLVSVALAEVSLRLRRSGHHAAAPLDLIRNFLLPAMAIIVLLVRVVGWERTDTSVRLVETLVWLFVINTALSFLNAFMFTNARPNT